MQDKAKLGTRYTCFECETKFYDLNRPAPICPECTADQSDADAIDPLAAHGKPTSFPDAVVVEESADTDDDDADVGSDLEEI